MQIYHKITFIVLLFLLCIFSYTQNADMNINKMQNRTSILYNKPTKFQIFNHEVETKSLTITTPECMFDNDKNTCRNYVKIFLSLDCKFHQTDNNHTFYLYLSPLYYNNYDSRFIANNGINAS